MKDIRFFIIFSVVLFVVIGCDKSNIATFTIENGTERTIELYLYSSGTQVEGPIIKNGPGVIIEREASSFAEPSPPNAFRTDSIVVIFDNAKIESHFGNRPIGRSLLFTADYEQMNDENYRYVISEEDFESAVTCDGPCN